MGFASFGNAIRERFEDQVGTPNSLVVHYDNGPPQPLEQSWYRLTIETMAPQLAETGGTARRYRTEGLIRVELHAPVGKGDGALLAIADAITTAFRNVSLASPDMHFRAPRLVGAPTRVDAWFRRVVEIPFWADEVGA